MRITALTLIAATLAAPGTPARADAVTDWNAKAGEILAESKLGTPPAVRVMAIVQTAVLRAATAAPAASVDAAVAAANRATLAKLLPAQQALIDRAYQAALLHMPDGSAKDAGIAAGELAAQAVLAARADDGAAAPDTYRPATSAGAYVPTAMPAVSQWPQRKPWVMASAAQFRPAPPPALGSEAWARDYEEVRALGGRQSARRSAEQNDIARFWEYSLPPIYHGVLRSAAEAPGRDVQRNARLFAVASQAMDDALISAFDAKYRYNFWRPVTAIRNGDADGNEATTREPGWAPLIDTPMHPEYPSAHSVLAAAVGAVIKAEAGSGPLPVLSTTSPTAPGATRRWTQVEDFVREVGEARVVEGVHYRFSTTVGSAMGEQIGRLAAATLLVPAKP